MKKLEYFSLVALCAGIGWFYFWTAHSNAEAWNFGAEQNDYYNRLADGWRAGQLHMKVEVPAELVALRDPYDPNLRPAGLGLHDASLYRGKYYLYFGIAPVVTLLLPFRLLTGVPLPLPLAVVLFTFAGFLASTMTWLFIRRRYFPATGMFFNGLCVLALATVSMGPVLVRRSNIWELPLSSGYCFAMVAVLCMFQSLHAIRSRVAMAWFAGAAVSLGLAIASRPTYVFGVGLLAVPVAQWWWTWWRSPRRSNANAPVGLTAAGLIALLLVVGGVGWHNYARFGDALEFGVRYQFSSIYEAKARHFSLDYVGYNLSLYWLHPASWSRYFPFFHPTPTPPAPIGYFGYEEVFGLLPNVPLLALALFAPLAVTRGNLPQREPLATWLLASASLGAGTALVLLFFYAAMARYTADFVPALVLLSCVGAAAVEETARSKAVHAFQFATTAVVRVVMVFSIFFAVMLSLRLYGNLRRLNPNTYAKLARVGNLPSHAWETISGTKHGPLEISLRFKPVVPGKRETLITTGWSGATDRVFVQYEANGQVRFGFAHDEGNEEVSRAVRADPAAPHRLRVEMGSLYPPEEHPFFARRTTAEMHRLARRLVVIFDGDVLLDNYQRFHPASRGTLVWGSFSGEVLEARRDSDWQVVAGEQRESCTLRIRFAGPADDLRQPLFTTTDAIGSGVWFVTPKSGGRMTVGCARSMAEVWESELMPCDFAVVHELEIAAIRPAGAVQPHRVIVKLDRSVIGSAPASVPFDLSRFILGKNDTALVSCAPVFRGSLQRVNFATGVAQFDALELEVKFPPGAAAASEPLVITGQTGRADFLLVEYLDAGSVRFRFEHWGKPPLFSPPFEMDRSLSHRLKISLGSFPRAVSGRAGAAQQVELWLDGRLAWTAPSKFYPAESADVFVGHNPIGGRPEFFSGTLLNVKYLAGGEAR